MGDAALSPTDGSRRPIVWQVLSALSLIAMAGIHFYLVFRGIGGLLGFLFVLNAIGGLVMAVANGRDAPAFVTHGLVRELASDGWHSARASARPDRRSLRNPRAAEWGAGRPTLIVESIGTILLVVTTTLVINRRMLRSLPRRRRDRD